jgi:hypothetical protein
VRQHSIYSTSALMLGLLPAPVPAEHMALAEVKKAFTPPGGTAGKSKTAAGLHAPGGVAASSAHATPLRSELTSAMGSAVAGACLCHGLAAWGFSMFEHARPPPCFLPLPVS